MDNSGPPGQGVGQEGHDVNPGENKTKKGGKQGELGASTLFSDQIRLDCRRCAAIGIVRVGIRLQKQGTR